MIPSSKKEMESLRRENRLLREENRKLRKEVGILERTLSIGRFGTTYSKCMIEKFTFV